MNPLNISDVQMVALKCLVACALESLLLITICICMVMHISIDATVLIEASTFVCAVGGISYTSFRTQRLTDYGYVEKKGDADAKIAEATKPSPVTVTTPPNQS